MWLSYSLRISLHYFSSINMQISIEIQHTKHVQTISCFEKTKVMVMKYSTFGGKMKYSCLEFKTARTLYIGKDSLPFFPNVKKFQSYRSMPLCVSKQFFVWICLVCWIAIEICILMLEK